MKEFIVLDILDMLTLSNDLPVTVHIDKKPYILCTEDYFKKQMKEPQESEEV